MSSSTLNRSRVTDSTRGCLRRILTEHDIRVENLVFVKDGHNELLVAMRKWDGMLNEQS